MAKEDFSNNQNRRSRINLKDTDRNFHIEARGSRRLTGNDTPIESLISETPSSATLTDQKTIRKHIEVTVATGKGTRSKIGDKITEVRA